MNNEIEKRFKYLTSMDVQNIHGRIWFSACNRNGLYCIDQESHEIQEKIIIENEYLSDTLLFHDMLVLDDLICLCPHNATNAVFYDTRNRKLYDVKLNNMQIDDSKKKGGQFAGIIRGKESIYLLGYSSPTIVKININTFEVEKIISNTQLQKCGVEEWHKYGAFTMGKGIVEKKVILPIGSLCAIAELDLLSDDVRIINLPLSLKGIGGISIENSIAWLVGRGSGSDVLVKWEINSDSFTEIKIPIETEKCEAPFYPPLIHGNIIYLVPLYERNVFEYNVFSGTITRNESLSYYTAEGCIDRKLGVHAFSPGISDNKLHFISGKSAEWIEYDIENKTIDSFRVIDKTDYYEVKMDYIKRSFANRNPIIEKEITIKDYVEYIDYEKGFN